MTFLTTKNTEFTKIVLVAFFVSFALFVVQSCIRIFKWALPVDSLVDDLLDFVDFDADLFEAVAITERDRFFGQYFPADGVPASSWRQTASL